MITHNREFFYKYVTAATAKAILRNCSVRWSSPRIFNDPFDIQFDLHLPFTEEEYIAAMMVRLNDLYENGRQSPLQSTSPSVVIFNNLFDLARANPDKLDKEEFFKELLLGTKEGASGAAAALPGIHAEVREIINDLCVFCISETHDNLLMWSHYAASHTGAVIKLKCLPEKDTALCAATQVSYQREMPVWASLESVVESNTGGAPLDPNKYLYAMAATKSEEWSYEKEWRLISKFLKPNQIEAGVADYTIWPEEIVEITFGCRMNDADKVEIAALSVHYPNVELSQASVHPKKFELVFSPIQIFGNKC